MAQEPSDNTKTARLKAAIEIGMAVLGFVWLALLIVEFAYGLSPLLTDMVNLIWVIFIVDFMVRFFVARKRLRYLRSNWLVGISLAVPAVRVFRVFRAVRLLRSAPAIRGIYLLRLFTSFRRSVRALATTMERRGAPYFLGVTLIVVFAGAAGMYAFERNTPQQKGFVSYWESVWWTVMIVTTIGTPYWPNTAAGKILCVCLSVYAVTVLGYIAASLASYFVGRDVADEAHPKK